MKNPKARPGLVLGYRSPYPTVYRKLESFNKEKIKNKTCCHCDENTPKSVIIICDITSFIKDIGISFDQSGHQGPFADF